MSETSPRTGPKPGDEHRIVFGVLTGDNTLCCGTDADVYLQLVGDGVQFPGANRWYVLDNPGDDMERGDGDSYWLESCSLADVHTVRFKFVRRGRNPEWDVVAAWLNCWQWNAEHNSWRVVEFRNRWSIKKCLVNSGIYDFGADCDELQAPHPLRQKARELLAQDSAFFNTIVDLVLPFGPENILRKSRATPVKQVEFPDSE